MHLKKVQRCMLTHFQNLIEKLKIFNKQIVMKVYRIKKSNIDKNGRGLYAAKDIKEGTKIIDYVGKIITKKKTEVSDKFDNSKPIYLYNLNKKYDLDGDVSFNTARLINHSCLNNCDYEGYGLKLWVVAIKDIKKGDELTCDYGFSYDSDYKPVSYTHLTLPTKA